jgi:hypothetical protein
MQLLLNGEGAITFILSLYGWRIKHDFKFASRIETTQNLGVAVRIGVVIKPAHINPPHLGQKAHDSPPLP